jgi:hypothetical protein
MLTKDITGSSAERHGAAALKFLGIESENRLKATTTQVTRRTRFNYKERSIAIYPTKSKRGLRGKGHDKVSASSARKSQPASSPTKVSELRPPSVEKVSRITLHDEHI